MALWSAIPAMPVPPALIRRPGYSVHGELASREFRSFRMRLEEGEFLDLAVVQDGVDVKAVLRDPFGRTMLVVDGPNRRSGPERLYAVAREPGDHQLDLLAEAPRERGRYEVRIEALRPAAARDRHLAMAAAAHSRGEKLRIARGDMRARNREALQEFTRAARLYQVAGDGEREAFARYRKSLVLVELGRPAEALAELAIVLPRWRGRTEEIAALNWTGRALDALHRSLEAFELYEQALALSAGRRDVWGRAASLQNLGDIYQSWGELQKAIDHYRSSQELWRDLGMVKSEAKVLGSMGNLLFQLGRYEDAIEAAQRGLEALATIDIGGDSALLRIVGISHGELEHWGPALDALNGSLYWADREGNRKLPIYVLDAIGVVHLRRGKLREATAALDRALKLADEQEDARGLAATLANLAQVFGERGDWRPAVLLLREAEDIYEGLGEVPTLPNVRFGLAEALRHTGQLGEARIVLDECLAGVEKLRSQPDNVQLRASLLADRHEYFAAYVDLLIEMDARQPGKGYGALAFEVSERARARSLLDELGESGMAISRGADPGLLRRKMKLERELLSRLASERYAPPERARSATPEIDALLSQLEELRTEIRRTSPRYASLTEPSPATLAETQRLLDEGTVLLAYLLGEERSFLWRITAETAAVHELPPREQIETVADRAYDLLVESKSPLRRRQAERELEKLGAMLLRPVAKDLEGRRLVVLPDGALHRIPFGVLPDPAAAGRASLIDAHEIVYLPSASVLALLRREAESRPTPPKLVAVLADPVFEQDDPRLSASTRMLRPPHAGAPRGLRDAYPEFPRLAFSKNEAEAISKLVPRDMSFVAIGFEANRQTVMSSKLGDYRILHIATHRYPDSRDPRLSGLLFSRFDESGHPRPGLLRLYEIYNLDLPVELVVLSACQTAIGPEVHGEGLIGLTRGFMYAGAPRVVVSLWDVNDEATAKLMEIFYEGMFVHHLPPAAALQRAQVTMKRQTSWRAPNYWAGFVLQGEWRSSVNKMPPAVSTWLNVDCSSQRRMRCPRTRVTPIRPPPRAHPSRPASVSRLRRFAR